MYVLDLTNTSTAGQIITLSWGDDNAVAYAGTVLYPAGTHSESVDSVFLPSNERITAISSAAAGRLSIHLRLQSKSQV